jgi:hypothetical protein
MKQLFAVELTTPISCIPRFPAARGRRATA